jgi:integrase
MNSGIRIGEAREIRWGNIRTIKTSEGDQVILSVLGKTDERDVVCNPNTNRYLERLYDHRREELNRDPDPSEPIFCHRDGRAIGSIKKSFASLLDFAGLTFNSRGQKRTPYSLRHSYATFRLEEVSVYFLAKNMGTSVEMIERFYGQTKTKEQAIAMTKGLPRAEETKEAKTRSYPFKA